ncbi:MAG: CaiB/BaiF CoA-transferase family protein [Burkholderiaceae bacterium]|jgi:alpha-methylacyl-CoA racemase|tara:strand:+ start:612 stop:1484 length:873 start_codon:yes stop_codon:yes gene_type:complete
MFSPTSTKPLRGVRIVSLALNLPGPACLMQLKAMGASCIKIEPPGGDPMWHYKPQAYAHMHAGIKQHSVDLKTNAGQTALAQQLATADVLLSSFRPSAMRKLGLGWRALHQRFPKLIHIDVVGAPGPLAEIPGHDLTYMAEQGLVNGLNLPPSLFADMGGALMATQATLSALLVREHTGQAKRQEVALSTAAQWLGLPQAWGLTTPDGAVGGAHAGYRVYACADGRVAVAALEPHFAAALATVAELKIHHTSDWFVEATRKQLARYFKRLSRAQLATIAAANDLPIHTMP